VKHIERLHKDGLLSSFDFDISRYEYILPNEAHIRII
jgi:hypothetical protein